MKKEYPADWDKITKIVKDASGWCCEVCGAEHGPPPKVLTVHHINYTPMDCREFNLVALCQVCHLKAQGLKVQPADKWELVRRMKPQGSQLKMV